MKKNIVIGLVGLGLFVLGVGVGVLGNLGWQRFDLATTMGRQQLMLSQNMPGFTNQTMNQSECPRYQLEQGFQSRGGRFSQRSFSNQGERSPMMVRRAENRNQNQSCFDQFGQGLPNQPRMRGQFDGNQFGQKIFPNQEFPQNDLTQ